ncbi:MFS transporter [Pseudonocardia sp. CA-107938]|uniref:MFS transporter n=1 Tax=Pseudonocardia sp. CA-107938 TaxID=3240021 RepID=UPI003D8C36F4
MRRASPWVVWAVGVLAYVVAVTQRTTLGVAGLDAAERFGISPGALATFVFVQLTVYVLAQIPAGVLVDRYGSRVMLTISALVMAAGQLLLATAPGVGFALLARVLVGAGDAVVFTAALALVPRWFPARRVPLMTQVTTILCQLGQVVSAVPFAALLHGAGWGPAFVAAAGAGVLVAGLAGAVVRNAPGAWTRGGTASPREIAAAVAAVWRRPGTRLGFFGHMGTQFSMMVFTLLWGVPYLVTAQGLSSAAASALLTLFVVATICTGPVIGVLTVRHPLRRSWLLLAVIGAQVTTWTAVLLHPGRAPVWLLVVLVLVLATGGPGSVVGIDIARTANPSPNLAVAQSMANLGGFLATLLVLTAMGGVLTALGGFGADAFRVAWLVQYPVWAVAVVGLLVWRRRARRLDAERGIEPRPLRELLVAHRRPGVSTRDAA